MYDLTLILPTLNERGNIDPLLAQLDKHLKGISWEVVFVDDASTDGTADVLLSRSRQKSNVRFLQRFGRRGLSSACIEGMLTSYAPYLAVMDADLQHDPSLLPNMFGSLKQDTNLDLVIGSRHVEGGSLGSMHAFSRIRRFISTLAAGLSRLVLPSRVTVKDPMSGFFMLRREFFMSAIQSRAMSPRGFKILLDLMVACPRPFSFKELPFQFGKRHSGDSKLDSRVSLDYIYFIAEKLFGRLIPLNLCIFFLLTVVLVVGQVAGVWLLKESLAVVPLFLQAQLSMAVGITTATFLGYNHLFFRLKRLMLLGGLLKFYICCSLGFVLDGLVATVLYQNLQPSIELFFNLVPCFGQCQWVLASAIGALLCSFWNHVVLITVSFEKL